MAFENLLKSGQATTPSPRPNFTTLSAATKHQVDLEKGQLAQSVMISQGELDFLSMLIKNGFSQIWPLWLNKRSEFIEKNIIFISNIDLEDPSDTNAVNRKVDILANWRAELKQVKEAAAGQNDQYLKEWQERLSKGVELEENMVTDPDQYLAILGDKLKFGGIIDHNRLSRLCGFGAQASKQGDLLTGIKSYSTAGLLPSMFTDFKNLIKLAKKKKNPQAQAAEDLLNNLVPINKK